MGAVIAVTSEQESSGKTTSVVTLAHYFARKHINVLIVDLTPAHHALNAMRDRKLVDLGEVMEGQRLYFVRGNLSVLASHYMGKENAENTDKITYLLEDFKRSYDLIFIDSDYDLALSLGNSVNYFILPIMLSKFIDPGDCSYTLWRNMAWSFIRRQLLHIRRVVGAFPLDATSEALESNILVLPTFYRWQDEREVSHYRQVFERYRLGLILPPIPFDAAFIEARAARQTIWEYAPRSEGVIGFTSRKQYRAYLRNKLRRVGGYTYTAQVIEDGILAKIKQESPRTASEA